MRLAEVEEFIESLFDTRSNDCFDRESGVTVRGAEEACRERLLEAGISHYFNHLPLDDCDFGTNNSLAEKLGLRILEKSHLEDGFYCGRIAEFSEATTLEELVSRLELMLEESGFPYLTWLSKIWALSSLPTIIFNRA
ncbi:MAG: Nif3-like dinuclear metal center hexameric protein [Firmicutes bacterium]|jgi:hypothetical protein|nr:Nif3-like dinuclear metal center hexameric protein [Bacillota bacterium]